MSTKVFKHYIILGLIICWLEQGTSGPVGPIGPYELGKRIRPIEPDGPFEPFKPPGEPVTETPGPIEPDVFPEDFFDASLRQTTLISGLEIASRKTPDGKWHHIISSGKGVARSLGLRKGQELLFIQPSTSSDGIACVGLPPAEIKRELEKIGKCMEFNIIVREGTGFRTITGLLGQDKRPPCRGTCGVPGPEFGKPGPEGSKGPNVYVTTAWSDSGFTSLPQRRETVFIQPFLYPSFYMKNQNGSIAFAALQYHPDWKFDRSIYINFSALMEGRLEPHAVFQVPAEPMFIHTDGAAVSLEAFQSAGNSGHDASELIFQNTFIQRVIESASQISSYESSNHRGKYLAYNSTTHQLYLSSSQGNDAKFYTKLVSEPPKNPTFYGRSGSQVPFAKIPGGPDSEEPYARIPEEPRGPTRKGPTGEEGPRGPAGPPGQSWSYYDDCPLNS